jgi:predicted cupin superfamily sugar epimerase
MPAGSLPEVWLRGPLPGYLPELMPAAHALLQAREDIERTAAAATLAELWVRPGEAAPAGYHLRHLTGSLDRLLTYARGEPLTDEQRRALAAEASAGASARELISAAQKQIDRALEQLRRTAPEQLAAPRDVGRAKLPTTVLGLLAHAAEHTARHTGQLITTLKVVRGSAGPPDDRAAALIRTLELVPHPEGGYYREIWRSEQLVEPADGRGPRAALTGIYFLLPMGAVSRWHRVRSDETWHFCEGAPLELLRIPSPSQAVHRTRVGALGADQLPVQCIPAGWWQAARSLGGYTLVTCTVAPGFEFADFELLSDRPELAAELRRTQPEASAFI